MNLAQILTDGIADIQKRQEEQRQLHKRILNDARAQAEGREVSCIYVSSDIWERLFVGVQRQGKGLIELDASLPLDTVSIMKQQDKEKRVLDAMAGAASPETLAQMLEDMKKAAQLFNDVWPLSRAPGEDAETCRKWFILGYHAGRRSQGGDTP